MAAAGDDLLLEIHLVNRRIDTHDTVQRQTRHPHLAVAVHGHRGRGGCDRNRNLKITAVRVPAHPRHTGCRHPDIVVAGHRSAVRLPVHREIPLDYFLAEINPRHQTVRKPGHKKMIPAVEREAGGTVPEVNRGELLSGRIDLQHPGVRPAARPQGAAAVDHQPEGAGLLRAHIQVQQDLPAGTVHLVVHSGVVNAGPQIAVPVDCEGPEVVTRITVVLLPGDVRSFGVFHQQNLVQHALVVAPGQQLGACDVAVLVAVPRGVDRAVAITIDAPACLLEGDLHHRAGATVADPTAAVQVDGNRRRIEVALRPGTEATELVTTCGVDLRDRAVSGVGDPDVGQGEPVGRQRQRVTVVLRSRDRAKFEVVFARVGEAFAARGRDVCDERHIVDVSPFKEVVVIRRIDKGNPHLRETDHIAGWPPAREIDIDRLPATGVGRRRAALEQLVIGGNQPHHDVV